MLHVVTGSDDRTAKVWELRDGLVTLIGVLGAGEDGENSWKGHTDGITSIAISDKNDVLTTSGDNTAMIWSAASEDRGGFVQRSTLPKIVMYNDQEEREEMKRFPFLKVMQQRYKTLRDKAEERKNKMEKQEKGHTRPIVQGIWCKGGKNPYKQIVTASDDGTAIIWDVSTAKIEKRLQGEHKDGVTQVMYNNEPRAKSLRLLTSSKDGTCVLWDEAKGSCLANFPAKKFQPGGMRNTDFKHEGPIWSAHLSEDDDFLLTAGQDGSTRVWEVAEPRGLYCFRNPVPAGSTVSMPTINAKFIPRKQNKIIMSWDLSGKLYINDTSKSGSPATVIDYHHFPIWTVEFSPTKDRQFLTSSHDTTAAIFDWRKPNRPLHVLEGHYGVLWQATYSPDEKYVLTCSEDQTARIFRLKDAEERMQGITLSCAFDHGSSGHTHDKGVTVGAFLDTRTQDQDDGGDSDDESDYSGGRLSD